MGFFGNLFGGLSKDEKLGRIKLLYLLAGRDGEISYSERRVIGIVLESLGLSTADEKQVLEELKNGNSSLYLPRSNKEKAETLYELVKLMLIDGKIDPDEMDFCKRVAMDMGANPQVIDELANDLQENEVFQIMVRAFNHQ